MANAMVAMTLDDL